MSNKNETVYLVSAAYPYRGRNSPFCNLGIFKTWKGAAHKVKRYCMRRRSRGELILVTSQEYCFIPRDRKLKSVVFKIKQMRVQQ